MKRPLRIIEMCFLEWPLIFVVGALAGAAIAAGFFSAFVVDLPKCDVSVQPIESVRINGVDFVRDGGK